MFRSNKIRFFLSSLASSIDNVLVFSSDRLFYTEIQVLCVESRFFGEKDVVDLVFVVWDV